MGDALAQQELDLTGMQLEVYASKDVDTAWWHPEHGNVATLEGWALLPTGKAFVTRTVKAAGPFWLAPGGRAAGPGSIFGCSGWSRQRPKSGPPSRPRRTPRRRAPRGGKPLPGVGNGKKPGTSGS